MLIEPILKKNPGAEIHWVTCERYKDVVLYNQLITGRLIMSEAPWAADKHYNLLNLPGRTLKPAPCFNPNLNGSLLSHWQSLIKSLGGYLPSKLIPTINLSNEEVKAADAWLAERGLIGKKVAMLETISGSSSTKWDLSCTILALKELVAKRYDAVLLTHMQDSNLPTFNQIIPTYCMTVGYRLIVPIYNRMTCFIGCSSAASVISHSNQASISIPHLEFVRGDHWSTDLYRTKTKKKIIHCDTIGAEAHNLLTQGIREIT